MPVSSRPVSNVFRPGNSRALVLALIAAAACRSAGAPAAPSPLPPAAPPAPDDPAVSRGILRRAGERIVDGAGHDVRLRGVAFGNQVWNHRALPTSHHGESDFGRVRAMGMN